MLILQDPVSVFVYGLMLVISIPLLMGKGSSMIAGYNTMPAEKKKKYNAKALCRVAGALVLFITACTVGMIELLMRGHYAPGWIVFALGIGVMVIFLIWVNKSPRFRNKEDNV